MTDEEVLKLIRAALKSNIGSMIKREKIEPLDEEWTALCVQFDNLQEFEILVRPVVEGSNFTYNNVVSLQEYKFKKMKEGKGPKPTGPRVA